MNHEETYRSGKTWWLWAMLEHTRLQYQADLYWDSLDGLQTVEDFNIQFNSYNNTCDCMDLLEAAPKCCFQEHDLYFVIRKDGKRGIHCEDCFPTIRIS